MRNNMPPACQNLNKKTIHFHKDGCLCCPVHKVHFTNKLINPKPPRTTTTTELLPPCMCFNDWAISFVPGFWVTNQAQPTSNVLHMLSHTLHLHFQELLTDFLKKRRKPVEFWHEMLRDWMLDKHFLLQTVAFNYPSFGCVRKSTLNALYQSVIWHADIYQAD